MKNTKQQRATTGFTIIEVLIVLAIAGLIMLVVFLAVPALQRNQRNAHRNSDAAMVADAVIDCLARKSYKINLCDDKTDLDLNINDLATFEFIEFPGPEYNCYDATACPNDRLSTGQINPHPHIFYGYKCTSDGTWSEPASKTQFVVLYRLEKADFAFYGTDAEGANESTVDYLRCLEG